MSGFMSNPSQLADALLLDIVSELLVWEYASERSVLSYSRFLFLMA